MEAKFVYESLGDIFKPKSNKELKNLSKIKKDEKLLWASKQGLVKLVQILLNIGADVDAKDNIGMTSLMWAAELGHKNIIKTIIDAGANINARDKDGWTALMIASRWGRKKMMKMLLDLGAGVNIRNKNGRTALDLTSMNDVADLLKRYGAIE